MKSFVPLIVLCLATTFPPLQGKQPVPTEETASEKRGEKADSCSTRDFYLPLAQDSALQDAEFKQFFYDNGQVSSEGYWIDGQPEGVWKNYAPDGSLVSQGTRKNLLLEGVWTFFENGRISSQITYHKNRKNGLSRYFHSNRIVSECYRNDSLQGLRRITDTSGRLLRTTRFDQGMENGFDKKYNQQGEAYSFRFFKNGMVVFQEEANLRDRAGLRQGLWKDFYENGFPKWECTYLDDVKNGYYKTYDSLGNLLSLQKYVMGVLQEESPELAELTVHTEYYANGMPKFRVGYKNGKPEGLCHQYDSVTGKVTRGIFFKDGQVVSSGQVDESGNIQDEWEEYYPDGKLRCTGRYYKGKKSGQWKFFYPNGSTEQEGGYKNGQPDGHWIWYYPNGNIRIEQDYYRGRLDGPYVEYGDSAQIIAKGSYVDGLEEGEWEYYADGEKVEGRYAGGERTGIWKSYWRDRNGKYSRLSFQGRYVGGMEDGKHQYFNENGKLREEGFYRMGRRVGTWYKYNDDGLLEMRISYDENEEEARYNGKRTLSKQEEEAYEMEQRNGL